MARRNDDDMLFGMLKSAFWVSAAVYTNAGKLGCMVMLSVFVLFFLLPVVISFVFDVSVEAIAPIFALSTCVFIFIGLISAFRNFDRKKERSRKINNRRDRLLSKYKEVVREWKPARYELENIGQTYHSDDEKTIIWKNLMAKSLCDGQIEWENFHNWDGAPWDLEWESWIQRNQDMWVRHRTSILYKHYRELVSYWVLSLDDLLYNQNVRMQWEKYPILFERDFDKYCDEAKCVICDRFSYDHAKMEYKTGYLIPVSSSDQDMMYVDGAVIPPPTIDQQKAWYFEDESSSQKSGRLSAKEKRELIG